MEGGFEDGPQLFQAVQRAVVPYFGENLGVPLPDAVTDEVKNVLFRRKMMVNRALGQAPGGD